MLSTATDWARSCSWAPSRRRSARGRSAKRSCRRRPSPMGHYSFAAVSIFGRSRNTMDAIEIRPVAQPLDARIRPPGSESLNHRAVAAAALAEGVSELIGALDSEDTRVMIDGLRRLGIAIDADSNEGRICVH